MPLELVSTAGSSGSLGFYEIAGAYNEDVSKRLQLSEAPTTGDQEIGAGLDGALQDAVVRFILGDELDRLSGAVRTGKTEKIAAH